MGNTSLPVFCGYAQAHGTKSHDPEVVDELKRVFTFRKNQLISQGFLPEGSHLYSPKVFHILGEYDYFIFSLVSDFSFAARYFREYYLEQTGIAKSLVLDNKYSYLSLVSSESTSHFIDTLDQYENKHPLIGIVHVKLHWELQLNCRFYFHEVVKSYLCHHFGDTYDFELFNALSWNEGSILVYSNSFALLLKAVEYINRIKFKDLYRFGLDYAQVKISDENVYVFIKSESTFGFSSKITSANLSTREQLTSRISNEDSLSWHIRATIKSSAILDVAADIKNTLGVAFWTGGKQDLFIPWGNNIDRGVIKATDGFSTSTSAEFISRMISIWQNENPHDVHFETYLLHPVSDPEDDVIHQPLDIPLYNKIAIPHSKILDFGRTLKSLQVPTSIRDILTNLIYTLDKNLKDPISQITFVSMAESVKDNMEYIFSMDKSAKNYSYLDHVDYILQMAYSLKVGIENRLQCSYNTRNFSETYTLFQGGIQMPLVCIEGVLGELLGFFGLPKSVVVCVDYRESIAISDNYLRLNYYHIYQPEKLVSIVCCEIALDLINAGGVDYSSLFEYSPNSNYMESQNCSVRERLDNEIIENLESKKESERKVLKSKFIDELAIVHAEITEDLFDHIVGDIFNYKIAYQSDLGLFAFWYWLNYLLMAKSHLSEKALTPNLLIRFILRYKITLRALGQQDDYSWTGLFRKLDQTITYDLNEKVIAYVEFMEQIEPMNRWMNKLDIEIENIIAGFKSNYNGNINFEAGPFAILRNIYGDRLRVEEWGCEPKYSGGIIPKTLESARFLFHERMQLYRSIYNEITRPALLDSLK